MESVTDIYNFVDLYTILISNSSGVNEIISLDGFRNFLLEHVQELRQL